MKAHALLLAAAIALSACAHVPSTGTPAPTATAQLEGDASRPAQAAHWVRSELYFGVGEESGVADRPQDRPIDEAQWRSFLDREVTPRFPDGLTWFDARGQWRGHDGQVIGEPSRVLILLHGEDDASAASVEAIRSAYKQAFAQEAVMVEREPSCVAF